MSFITLDLFYKHFLKYSESFNINIQILRVYVLLVICNFFLNSIIILIFFIANVILKN